MNTFCHYFTCLFYSLVIFDEQQLLISIKYNWSLFLVTVLFKKSLSTSRSWSYFSVFYFRNFIVLPFIFWYETEWLLGKVVTRESLHLLLLRFVNFISKYFIFSCYCQWSCFIHSFSDCSLLVAYRNTICFWMLFYILQPCTISSNSSSVVTLRLSIYMSIIRKLRLFYFFCCTSRWL